MQPHEAIPQIRYWVPDDQILFKYRDGNHYREEKFFYKYVTSDWKLVVSKYKDGDYEEHDLFGLWFRVFGASITNISHKNRQEIAEQERLKNPDDYYSKYLREIQLQFGKMIEDEFGMTERLDEQEVSKDGYGYPINKKEIDKQLMELKRKAQENAVQSPPKRKITNPFTRS